MLDYNEVKEGKIIIYQNEPYEVVSSHVARTQQRKPQNQVKLKNLINGKTISATFHVSDKVEEAEITKKEIKFLYENRGEYWFSDTNNPRLRFKLSAEIVGEAKKFLKPNLIVNSIIFGDDASLQSVFEGKSRIIKIILPIKMEFLVKEAPPSIKGDSATSGTKPITLENGTIINAPLFVEVGDIVVVNTETGEYVERKK